MKQRSNAKLDSSKKIETDGIDFSVQQEQVSTD